MAITRRGALRLGAMVCGAATQGPLGIGRTLASSLVDEGIVRSGVGTVADPVRFQRDDTMSADMLVRYPGATLRASNGHLYRLADEHISVEAFGALGDGDTNDQPSIQQAIDFAEAVGAPRVRFLRAAYSLWCPRRTSDPSRINDSYDGISIIVSASLELSGRPGGRSTLTFKSPNGAWLSQDWQVVDGKVWRGPGIFLRGRKGGADKGPPPDITLRNLVLDGGCDRGAVYSYPADRFTGDGWDMTQKALWCENDRRTGNWEIYDTDVVRFRGEMFYQGGSDHGSLLCRNVRMGSTNADILNPCGTGVDIADCHFFDGNQGWEGWGGRKAQIVRTRFENCRSMGGIQGGRASVRADRKWQYPTRFVGSEIPWIDLDIDIVNCGPVYIGSWIRGTIRMTDSMLALSSQVYPTISDIQLTLRAKAVNKSYPAVISLTGSQGQDSPFKRVEIDVISDDIGRRGGHGFKNVVMSSGHVGEGIAIRTADR